MSTHEDFATHHKVQGPSDRSFGIVFTVFFGLVGLLPLRHGNPVRWWAIAVSLCFLAVTAVRPSLLRYPNELWMKLSLLLNKIVTPIMMGLLFYVAVVPMAFIARVRGKDLLHLGFNRDAKSYWQLRQPPGPAPETMSNQF